MIRILPNANSARETKHGCGWVFILLLFSSVLEGQQTLGSVPTPSAPQNQQAISQTGLLPVYGIDLQLDPTWVDQKQFPSAAANFPNSGTSPTLQRVWAALQPGGYNVLRVALDVRDAGLAANRAANLSVWAKANNVQLIFVLTDSDAGQPIGKDYPTEVAAFAKTLVAQFRVNNGQYFSSYSQIMAFQLEDELNHMGRHGGMSGSVALPLVLQAAKSFRQSEKDALQGTGSDATPLMCSASFDFELIKAGAIAGVTLSDADYNQAYQSLKQFLSSLSSSQDIDLLTVDWLAGSLSAGGLDRVPPLLKSVLSDVPGKQLVFSVGFSTAFRSADEQKRLFATAFSNLSDFRASNGTSSPFVGAIFREALNAKNSNPSPPRAALPVEMENWDWKARAAELTAMWTQKKKSVDMAWWLAKVENNLGLVALQSDSSGQAVAAPSPAQQGMTQIAAAVSDVNAQMAAAVSANPIAGANGLQTGAIPSIAGGAAIGSAAIAQPQTTLTASPYGIAAANVSGQPGCSNANASLNPAATVYGQPYAQTNLQQFGQQYGQPLGQPNLTPGAVSPGCGKSIVVQDLQVEAQKGLMGLLDGVLQRVMSLTNAGNPGNAYSNGGISATYGSSTNSYNYGSVGQPSTQTPQPLPAAAAAVQLGPQDISLQSPKPQVGTPDVINVNLHNPSATDLSGLVVQAAGSDGTAFAPQAGLHLAPNANTSIAIPWVPASAVSSYSITVNVADSLGNQLATAQMTPVAVTASSGSSGGGGNGSPGSGGSNGNPGTTGGTGSTGGSGGTGGRNSTSCANLGAANLSPGAVNVTGIQLGTTGEQVVAGQATLVVVSLSNPNQTSLRNVKGSLCVDGKVVQNQALSLLLSQQSRSLVFRGVTLSQPGQHQLSVSVDSQNTSAQTLTASQTQQVTVAVVPSGGTKTGGVRTIGTPSPVVSSVPPPAGRPLAANVRSVTPLNYQIGHLVVPNRPGPQVSSPVAASPRVGVPPSGSGSPANPITQEARALRPGTVNPTGTSTIALAHPLFRPGVGLPPVPARPGFGGAVMSTTGSTLTSGCTLSLPAGFVELSVNALGVLQMNPGQPRPGQAVSFLLRITNPATSVPQGAFAVFALFEDGQKVSESSRVALSPPNPGCAAWSTTIPLRPGAIEIKAEVLANNAVINSPNRTTLSFAARVR